MLGLTNSELETQVKKLQTKKTTSKCQKNQEADLISEGMRQKQTPILQDIPILNALIFISSLSGSAIGFLLAYILALKILPSQLPVAPTTVSMSSVIMEREEMSEVL